MQGRQLGHRELSGRAHRDDQGQPDEAEHEAGDAADPAGSERAEGSRSFEFITQFLTDVTEGHGGAG